MPASLLPVPFGFRRSRGRFGRIAAGSCVVALVATTAACFDQPAGYDPAAERDDALVSDSTLARDLTLADRAGQRSPLSDTVQVAAHGAVAPAVAPTTPAAPAVVTSPTAPTARTQQPVQPVQPARRVTTQVAATRERVSAPRGTAPVATAAPAGRVERAAPPATETAVAVTPQPRGAAGERADGAAQPSVLVPIPAAAPAPAASGRREIAAGSTLALTTAARVCTANAGPGDKIVATLDDAARGTSGFTLSAGTKAVLEVASVERDAGSRPSAIHFRLRNLDDGTTAYRVSGEVATLDTLLSARSTKHPSAVGRNVAGGAVIGAVAGQVLGRNTKSTVIGTAAGGALGGVLSVAKSTTRQEACLPAGAKVQVRLAEPVVGN